MAKMIGDTVPVGPGGRGCACCADAPAHRRKTRRALKRRERQTWKKEIAR